MKALVDAVIAIVESLESKFVARFEALEQRQAVVGPPGPEGLPGPQGLPGMPGLNGLDGARGEKGDTGDPGMPGERGPSGLDGKDGAPGRDGRDGLQGLPGEKGLDGKDGTNGKDGRDGVDGLGFDDWEVEFDGERTFTFKFVQGDRVKSFGPFRVPCTIYRGVYQLGKSYERGDSVTWAGSQWIAMTDTASRPGDSAPESRAWQLSVKKGADGKAGPPGPKGEFVVVKAEAT